MITVVTVQSFFGAGFSQAQPAGVAANTASFAMDTAAPEYDPVTVARILEVRRGPFETVPKGESLHHWLTK